MTEGINAASVTAWLADHIEDVRAPFTFELISGGRSNLTFKVTDAAGRRLVLRRPPMSHVLPTAHDMGREYRIISALRPTPVPVAPALGYCDDEAVNERPFYIMEFVDGFILRGAAEGRAALDERTRRVAGEDLVDVLAAIHHVDVDEVGLGSLARRDGYIERQLRRWHGQFQQSQLQAREIGVYRPVPLVDEVHRLLADRVPQQHGTAIVHGDYRIDNTVISAEGRVQAVLDWELCTLGDALADVGTLMAYWSDQAVAEMADAQPVRGGGEAGGTGESFIDPAELMEIVRQLDARGFDVHMHAVGDRAVRECLDALAACGGDGRPRGARHQIAHIDLIQPGDVTRMARLGAIANVQPLWAREDKVLVETKLPYLTAGQQRNHFAFGSLLAAGVPLAMGSDWPVSSPDPLWGIHVAVNRTAPHADPHAQDFRAQTVPLLAGEAVDVRSAVYAYTLGAARANRLDAETGSLEPGKLADLVVLDRDPFAVPARELSSVRVRATFVDGSLVHGAC